MRRIATVGVIFALSMLIGCDRAALTDNAKSTGTKVVIIGMDGMDPRLATQMMDAGELPNFDSLRKLGGYKPLGTSIPPQSPVAWSNFITGSNPGTHGVYDFLHRRPEDQFSPFYGAAETVAGEDGWKVGEHNLPLTFWPFEHQPTQTLLRRHGIPFWDYLDERGIETRIYDIPANYPPSESKHGHHCCLSGMGTPDLMGSYGTYQLFAEDGPFKEQTPGGGLHHKRLNFRNDVARASLRGPMNIFLQKTEPVEIDFTIHRDRDAMAVVVRIQDQDILLEEKQWSDWVRIEFDIGMPSFLPNESWSGICQFYLQQVKPKLRLYVSPINVDPTDPAFPVSEPPDFIEQIAEELDLFYTTGFQEDRNARTNDVFTDEEYKTQADDVLDERMELLDYAMEHYEDGLLFFYFSSTDQQAHIFWWDSDKPHPVRTPEEADRYHNVVRDVYRRMDDTLGRVFERFGDQALVMVMSDHGFSNFRRQFNLNRWLRDNGYISPANSENLLIDADWSKTRAYGLGLNGLYLNLKGRERDGIVERGEEQEALITELIAKLEAVRDEDSSPVIKKVYRADEVYSGPEMHLAPDLIVGYYRDYRVSWSSTAGEIPPDESILSDNDSAWSADHCMAADEVPGVIFSNRPIQAAAPALIDVAPTILTEFGIDTPATMVGRSFLAEPKHMAAADE